MKKIKFIGSILIMFLIIHCTVVNGQNESIIISSDSINPLTDNTYFNASLFGHLPFTGTSDIFQLNPALYRNSAAGTFLIDGFSTSGDYTLFDGIPMDFIEEMPLRLIGEVKFNDFHDFLTCNNTITGYARLEPLRQTDSLTVILEPSSRMIHGHFNDADLQLIISGPLIKQTPGKNNSTSLNFTLAGRLFSASDPNPSYIGRDQASADYLDYLADEPLRPSEFSGTYPNACFTHATNAVSSYFNSNAAKKGFSLYGSVSAEAGNGMFLKLGTYTVKKKETIPVYDNFFFNQDKNPDQSTLYSNNYITLGQILESGRSTRFTYQVQGNYSIQKNKIEDPDYGEDFFKYGYVGKFETFKRPTYELGSIQVGDTYYEQALILNSWDYDTLVDFSPGEINPGLAAYTSSYFDIFVGEPDNHYGNKDQIQLGGGILNGQNPDKVYGLWNNTGTVYNYYSKEDNRRINIAASGMLELDNHKIKIGFQFRRDSYSSYQANPVGLWGLMRSMTNFHINELDLSNPEVHEGGLWDSVFFYRKYDAASQHYFDRNLREALGLDPDGTDFIDIDSYDFITSTINYFDKEGLKHTIDVGKELFSLDMFSADELLNDGIASFVTYSGYDHLGNKNGNKFAFEDFFTATDGEGEYIRPVGAYTPMNYTAYADYQAEFRGWSVEAGLRMDLFDAHQQVLKDPYLFYEAYTVGELGFNPDFLEKVPQSMDDHYVVYVDNENHPTRITGYRYGDQWFDEDGLNIDNPAVLDVGSGICPYLINPDQENITTSVFTGNQLYFNFLPQISVQKNFKDKVMVAFTYNSSVQDPYPELTFSNPASYYFINNASTWVPNGSLKPERTDKLRLGISAMPLRKIVITAEGFIDYFSNMIYPVTFYGAYPKSYKSFQNEEKPFAQYGTDLAIRGISGKISGFNYGLSYHLLFNKDNPAYHLYDYLVPKSLLKGYFQFNTGFGKDYQGPAGSANYTIFSGLGIGLFSQLQSGVYYLSSATVDGSTYMDYKSDETIPAQVFLDMKVEKGFHFNDGRYHLTLYCTIRNLFDKKLIYKVYRFTGQPDDNGYLTAPESQKQISEALDPESYRYLYASYINNPSHYGMPRRTTLGIIFDF